VKQKFVKQTFVAEVSGDDSTLPIGLVWQELSAGSNNEG
jgi:hypothetical protein